MTKDTRIFKSENGQWLIKQIFWETADPADRSRVLYSLKTEDHKVGKKIYPSLRRLYMEMGDESEFLFADTFFGGWPHWKRLTSSPWFLDHLSELREELAARNAAIALSEIRKAASSGNFNASKYLLEQGWIPKDKKVGRPTKERIRHEAEKISADHLDITDDLERISQAIGSFSS